MQYQDFNIIVSARQGTEYLISAITAEQGRVNVSRTSPDSVLWTQVAQIAELDAVSDAEAHLREVGSALFRWLLPGPLESHLRIAWDHAQRARQGLRLRLSIDAPELAAWPWELLHDPVREHTFAVSPMTLLVRSFDQAAAFGSLVEQRAELPLDLLLVLPAAPDLNLAAEQLNVEAVAAAMPGALRVRTLTGVITRVDLADALLLGDYDMVHFSGHGAFIEGRGYVALNKPDGSQDWIHSGALSRLAVNYGSIKLVVLNTCSSGRAEDGRAFQGLAPQMVRYGVPAVVAMQYPIADDAATVFSREFYKRLCLGGDAGQVDVAVAYARSMLSILFPEARAWATPVLYTHAANGVIYAFTGTHAAGQGASVLAPARLSALRASLDASQATSDSWRFADPTLLARLRPTLRQAADAYRSHLATPDPQVQLIAQQGLRLTEQRIDALDKLASAVASA